MSRKKPTPVKVFIDRKNPNFIEPGSERHMAIVGLRLSDEHDTITVEGEKGKYAHADLTKWGPNVRDEFLRRVLVQKVAGFETGFGPAPQSEDPFADNYAPPLWSPENDMASSSKEISSAEIEAARLILRKAGMMS